MSIGFGIIGCGMIADFHAKAISTIADAKLIGCADHRIENSQSFASTHSIEAFPDYDKLVADRRIDVVTICTPSGAHMEPAVLAAAAGKHVVVEKPLEINLERCDQIIRACEQNSVTLSTVFPSRFQKSSLRLKKAVDEGRFGKITMGDAYVKWFRTQEYYDSGKWRGTWSLDGGGALMNQAIHSVDLLLWLIGPVVEVTARTATLAHDRIEVEDVAVAILRFKNGALGTIEATTAAFPGWLKKFEIHGTQGSASIEEDKIRSWDFAEMNSADQKIMDILNKKTDSGGGGAADPSSIGIAGHVEQFKNVVHAIETKTKPAIDGNEGRKSVELIRAVYKSAKTGEAVSLPLHDDKF